MMVPDEELVCRGYPMGETLERHFEVLGAGGSDDHAGLGRIGRTERSSAGHCEQFAS
jgi:hypothetical protein